MKKKNVSKRKAAVIGVAALAMLGAGAAGSLAYLTDSETNTNVFTDGKVQVDLVETAYDAAVEAGQNVHMVPNQELAMDPKIENTGINDAIVYLKVSVPVKEVTKVADDGTKETRAKKEIVYLKDEADKITDHANNFDADWVQLTDKESGTALDGDTRTYVFGYKKAIGAGESTSTLFEKAQVMNVLENDLIPDATENVKVEVYAIQKDNILKADGAYEITDNMSAEDLGAIYDIFMKQGSAGQGKNADADVQTNINAQDADTNGSKDLAGQDL